MAQKLWTEAIDKNVDWSNVDGNGTPASGEVVQNFLKDTLQQRRMVMIMVFSIMMT